MGEHLYVRICEQARCSPDTFRRQPKKLLERWQVYEGGSLDAFVRQLRAHGFKNLNHCEMDFVARLSGGVTVAQNDGSNPMT